MNGIKDIFDNSNQSLRVENSYMDHENAKQNSKLINSKM